jgi:hypothetical protein
MAVAIPFPPGAPTMAAPADGRLQFLFEQRLDGRSDVLPQPRLDRVEGVIIAR